MSAAKSKWTYKNLREEEDLTESDLDSRMSDDPSSLSLPQPDSDFQSDNKTEAYQWEAATQHDKTVVQRRKSLRHNNPKICVQDTEEGKSEEVFVKSSKVSSAKISADLFSENQNQNEKDISQQKNNYVLNPQPLDEAEIVFQVQTKSPLGEKNSSQVDSMISEKESSSLNQTNDNNKVQASKTQQQNFMANVYGVQTKPRTSIYESQLSQVSRSMLSEKKICRPLMYSAHSNDSLASTHENLHSMFNIKSKYLDLQNKSKYLDLHRKTDDKKLTQRFNDPVMRTSQKKFIGRETSRGTLLIRNMISNDSSLCSPSPKIKLYSTPLQTPMDIPQDYESPLDVYQLQSKSLNQNNLVKRTEDREIRIRTLSSQKPKLVQATEELGLKKMKAQAESTTSDNVSKSSQKSYQRTVKVNSSHIERRNHNIISSSAAKTFSSSNSFALLNNSSLNSTQSPTKFLPQRRPTNQNQRAMPTFNSDQKFKKKDSSSSLLKPLDPSSPSPQDIPYVPLITSNGSYQQTTKPRRQQAPSPNTNHPNRREVNRPNRIQVNKPNGGIAVISSLNANRNQQKQRRVKFEESPPTTTETNFFGSSGESPETATFRPQNAQQNEGNPLQIQDGMERERDEHGQDITFGRAAQTAIQRKDSRRSSKMSEQGRDLTPPKTYNVMMFGDNRKGACGLDHIENKYIYCPVEMRAHRFIKIACGQLHCMGINQQGKVVSWGSNKAGQLGRPKESDEQGSGPSPAQIIGLNVVIKDIACGFQHSLALSTTGEVYAWGLNICGQLGLGDNTQTNYHQPNKVQGIPQKVKKIAAGQLHSGAVTVQGDLYMWGHNPDCRLLLKIDDQRTPADRNVFTPQPVQIKDKDHIEYKISYLSCGTDHTMIIDEQGEAWAAGNSEWGQLGMPHYDFVAKTCKVPYKKVLGLQGPVRKVCCGDGFSLALAANGKVYSCGKGNLGRLGLGIEENIGQMVEIQYFRKFDIRIIDIAAGGRHCLALAEDHSRLFVWGCNFYYQLGQYHQDDELEPVKNIYITKRIKSVACGQMNSAVMVEDF